MPATTRRLEHPDLADVQLPAVLFALSDPARLDLVRELASQGPLTVAQCQATGPDVPKSTFSHHLKTLREAGLVRNEPAGRQRTVSLRRAEIDARFPGLLAAVLAD
jgi:DNA-binding transcriptional ArsR family regulator